MSKAFIGDKEYFSDITKINYEGSESDNPLAFKYYDENKIIGDKTMKDHLRFAVCYWHTFCGTGADPFGPGTQIFKWNDVKNSMTAARQKLDAAFGFFTKLGVPYYCFHDIDMAPVSSSVIEQERNLKAIVSLAKERQNETGMKLLWGTANVFSNPRYMNGASTNPDFEVLTHAAAQVKNAIDATIELNGENYVFCDSTSSFDDIVLSSYTDSTTTTPIYFILSPGSNPVLAVETLARKQGFDPMKTLHTIALGQGQDVIAMNKLDIGHKDGHWVML